MVLEGAARLDAARQAVMDRFLARIDAFLGFFFTDLNGIAATPSLVHGWATR